MKRRWGCSEAARGDEGEALSVSRAAAPPRSAPQRAEHQAAIAELERRQGLERVGPGLRRTAFAIFLPAQAAEELADKIADQRPLIRPVALAHHLPDQCLQPDRAQFEPALRAVFGVERGGALRLKPALALGDRETRDVEASTGLPPRLQFVRHRAGAQHGGLLDGGVEVDIGGVGAAREDVEARHGGLGEAQAHVDRAVTGEAAGRRAGMQFEMTRGEIDRTGIGRVHDALRGIQHEGSP